MHINRFLGLKPLYIYGPNINHIDTAKFLAIFLMITDHFGYFFMPQTAVLQAFGRVSFPILVFLTCH